nr:type II toxin-antitoxin system RelE/ParE family toxin [Mesorhizobium sp. SEMIA396]
MPEALADLRWIYDTIEIAAGNVTAIRYIERIEAYCQGLDYASERGTRRDDLRPGPSGCRFRAPCNGDLYSRIRPSGDLPCALWRRQLGG